MSLVSRLAKAERANPGKKPWKEVRIEEWGDGLVILLDELPIRTPLKKPIVVPNNKPFLANAIALEWSLLNSAQDALMKRYRTPLTQLAARVVDMHEPNVLTPSRDSTISSVMRYLDTDTLIFYAPTPPEKQRRPNKKTLRELQVAEAEPIVEWLTTVLWPGTKIECNDGDSGFMAAVRQPPETLKVIREWLEGLTDWDLVALEMATLSSKSFLIGARLVAEWSSELGVGGKSWGIEEAAMAASVEVRYQTEIWGEVKDTHDVDKEDIKRQLGAAWLLALGAEG
ncbi:ATP12-domain-containing protein [Tuber magnatum]|uniref:ATP12-domain-containing protein n=1 Tax=Tuber magnatum TaxID=42249 RepID=A0A317T241_9PEZI|nr:ATP12-domain-containing protein [Tuber magnatum]